MKRVNKDFGCLLDVYESTCCGATLSCRSDCRKEDGRNGQSEIGVVQDDDTIVSTEFENRLSETRLNGLCHLLTDLTRTRERQERNSFVFAHSFADRHSTTDQRRQTTGKLIAFQDTFNDST